MSSPTPSPVLSERLRSALEELEVDPGALTARVLDTTVTASTLPELRHALAYKIYEVLHAGMTLGDEPALRTLRDRRYERLLSDAVAHHDTLVEASVTEAATSADNARRIATIDGVRTLVDAPTRPTHRWHDVLTGTGSCCAIPLAAPRFLRDSFWWTVPAGAPEPLVCAATTFTSRTQQQPRRHGGNC